MADYLLITGTDRLIITGTDKLIITGPTSGGPGTLGMLVYRAKLHRQKR